MRTANWPIESAATFISGHEASDTEVEYVLETETWHGSVRGHAVRAVEGRRLLIQRAGLEAEALPDLRPAQWSKLTFNATLNSVAGLTGLRDDSHLLT